MRRTIERALGRRRELEGGAGERRGGGKVRGASKEGGRKGRVGEGRRSRKRVRRMMEGGRRWSMRRKRYLETSKVKFGFRSRLRDRTDRPSER